MILREILLKLPISAAPGGALRASMDTPEKIQENPEFDFGRMGLYRKRHIQPTCVCLPR
jgi:hypothetical protein